MIPVALEIGQDVLEIGVLDVVAGKSHFTIDEIHPVLRQAFMGAPQHVQVVSLGVGFQPVDPLKERATGPEAEKRGERGKGGCSAPVGCWCLA